MAFELFITSRYLRIKQKQAFISLITVLSIAGVTVGVMALIVVIAVMSGFETDLKTRILDVNSHLIIERTQGPFTDYNKVAASISRTDGVEAATPYIYTQAMLRSATGISGAVLRGIDPDTAPLVSRADNFEQGSLEQLAAVHDRHDVPGTRPGMILGSELALLLGVKKGDAVYLISPRGMISPMGHLPAMKRFRVVGLFKSGMYEYDSGFAYVHLADARKILRKGDAVSGIDVKVKNIYDAGRIGKQIITDIGREYTYKDWMLMNRNLFSALKLEKAAMFIILTLIVLVAAFNIASSLIMMVMEKTRDIAILKAMGATDGGILRIFVYKGMTVGAAGTFLGVSFGCLVCTLLEQYKFIELPPDVYYITTLPVRLESVNVALIAAATLVICFLSTLYPARQAARLDPVEAFRYG